MSEKSYSFRDGGCGCSAVLLTIQSAATVTRM